MALAGYAFIPKGATKEGIAELISFLSHAKKEVRIVSGGLESAVYEKPEVISEIRGLLERGVNFRAIVGPYEQEEFMKDHAEFKRLFDEYGNQIQIYSTSDTPKAHYAVIDNKHVLYEEYHKHNRPREIHYLYSAAPLAGRLKKSFEQLASNRLRETQPAWSGNIVRAA